MNVDLFLSEFLAPPKGTSQQDLLGKARHWIAVINFQHNTSQTQTSLNCASVAGMRVRHFGVCLPSIPNWCRC